SRLGNLRYAGSGLGAGTWTDFVNGRGIGPAWERKFLDFRINPQGQIEVAPPRVERFRNQVREG
ncbi:MAG: hypothetical protein HY674_04790, partial [Chloroflexi bacterium]|nr:hypothetical protein [Chloroflexota bacterium]